MIETDTVILALKQAMQYVDVSECCSTCKHFRKATREGLAFGGPYQTSTVDRCKSNAIEIPVSPGGHCSFYSPLSANKPVTVDISSLSALDKR